jgi:hypothetical protein
MERVWKETVVSLLKLQVRHLAEELKRITTPARTAGLRDKDQTWVSQNTMQDCQPLHSDFGTNVWRERPINTQKLEACVIIYISDNKPEINLHNLRAVSSYNQEPG